ncbi:hypothetical protein [Halobacillus mangrovi]|uniref:Uncharacterized protein n=1 Tax=Halobacillus mangrovi TaxID=402384 RepID=A0A1W5ZQS0_9BACI|nr:hypothetical protein [Halobacillus mangrovi]ARI75628.1 hypothetical protein HM131_01760 [Halobacillus mangrovi]
MKRSETIGLVVIGYALLCFFIFSFSGIASAEESHKILLEKPIQSPIKPIEPQQTTFDKNKKLSEREIQERFSEIDASYDLHEPFSPEDAEFIRAYATIPITSSTPSYMESLDSPDESFTFTGSNSKSFDRYKSSNGVSLNFYGRIYSDINIFTHSYRGNVKSKIYRGSSKVREIKNVITNTAYGLVGSSGTYVGIVYKGSIVSSSNDARTSWSTDETRKYGAVGVLYTHTNAYSKITTTTGTFTLYAF